MTKTLVTYILIGLTTCQLYSQTAQIKQLENRRKQVMTEIQNTNAQLKEIKQTFNDLQKKVALIEKQINARKEIINLLEQENKAIQIQQQITENEIQALEVELRQKKKNYDKAIKAIIYRNQGKNKLLYILSGKSLAEAMRRMKFLKEYSDWRSNEADQIKSKTAQLQQKHSELEQQRKQKIIIINQKDAEQQSLIQEEENHKKAVAEAQKKEKELQKEIARKQQQINQLNNRINKLIAQEVARQKREAERKAREQALAKKQQNSRASRQNRQGKNNQTTKQQNSKTLVEAPDINNSLSRNFASNKGKLPIPLTGRYAIVSRFGTHKQGNITINNNGIDLQGQPGAEARAVFNGEISHIVSFPGFNNCIIIRHGNYYTFYGNIQNVYVRQGQTINTGETLGKIFSDPETGITKMHFQLWNGTRKQDPSPWLQQ